MNTKLITTVALLLIGNIFKLYSFQLINSPIGDSLYTNIDNANQVIISKDTLKLLQNANGLKATKNSNKNASNSEKSAANDLNCIAYILIEDGMGNSYSGDFICPGRPKVLYAKAYDNYFNQIPNVSFHWFRNGEFIPNGTQPTLEISSGGNYLVQAIYPCIAYSSNYTVYETGTTGSILRFTENYACIGSSKTLMAWFYSNNAEYQWQINGINIPNSNTRVFQASETGLYSVNVTDGTCVSQDNTKVKITMVGASMAPLYVSDTLICGNSGVRIFGTNYGRYNEYTYAWQKDGNYIPYQTQSSIYVTEPGSYNLVYTLGNCVSKSKTILIAETPKNQIPTITSFGTNEICNGTLLLTQTSTTDGNNIVFGNSGGTWLKDDVEVAYNQTQFVANASGTYKMKYGYGSCEVESNAITVKIAENSLNPHILINNNQFDKTNICGNDDFVVLYYPQANYMNNVSFQWRRNGQNLIDQYGSLIFIRDAGTYTLVVTNGNCVSESNAITITKNAAIQIISGENNLLCHNKLFKLQTDLVSGVYQGYFVWRKNGQVIANETSNELLTSEPGEYTVSVNNNGCNAISSPFSLNVNIPVPLSSITSGDWNQPATWTCGQVPHLNLDVQIAPGHVVQIPDNIIVNAKSIINNGILNFGQNAGINLAGQ